jgi:hypothetical protein
MFIYGGLMANGGTNDCLYVYEPAVHKWSVRPQTASDESHPGPRDEHSAVVYKDSMVLFGGFTRGEKRNDMYQY